MRDTSQNNKESGNKLATNLGIAVPQFTLEQVLSAIEKDQFYLVAQAQVDLESFELVGFEFLARWHHPEYGDLLPYHFIPLLEKEKQCHVLTLHLFERVLTLLSSIQGVAPDIHFSLNISANDLCREKFANHIIRIANAYEVDMSKIVLEVTETAGIFGENSVNNLQKLHEYGILLAVDDFWTGFSTLETIRLGVFSEIKIDYSLTSQLINDKTSMAGVNSILQLSSDLGMRCVVEGIETCMVRSVLLEAGAVHGQGFLFSKGVKEDALANWIEGYTNNKSNNPCNQLCLPFTQNERFQLEARPHPSWIWDFENNSIKWANRSALEFWQASSKKELEERDFSGMSYLVKTRLQSYQRRLQAGEEEISSEWDFFPSGDAKKVLCMQLPRIDESSGKLVMLVNAFEGFQSRLPPRKHIESSNKFPVPFIVVDEDGKLLRINKHAHIEINIETDHITEFMSQQDFDSIKHSCGLGQLVQRFTKFDRIQGHNYLYIRAVMIPDKNEHGRNIYHIVAIPVSELITQGMPDVSD
ncbi:EAL domain-containing protein [Thalassotalea sediminis]|uniref:EAL domain-containing protein n=1 Tax=Thalassotalea sediminis TaxID=1759089 RepID=UPI002573B2A5|nr:EAL domain-containing protein [Thalassotalea sediminis]